MVDMVRKHTVEGTGNWRTIMDMVRRADEMLRTSKQLQYSFVRLSFPLCLSDMQCRQVNIDQFNLQVPPPNQRDQVPLGVSSDSMYPGYSPADHQYGKAAEEYGKAVAEAKRKGVVIPKHPDIDYQIGQGKGIKRKSLAQIREMQQNQSGSGSGSGEEDPSAEKQQMNGRVGSAKVKTEETATKDMDTKTENNNPIFVIDTQPTPVNIPGHLSSHSKREAGVEATEGKTSKKPKKKHSGDLPAASARTDETEDISAEVDARMTEKEEKRKRREDKKRKRESEKSEDASTEAAEPVTDAAERIGEKPKKKKKKVENSKNGEELPDRTMEKKRAGEQGEDEGKNKKRKKNKE